MAEFRSRILWYVDADFDAFTITQEMCHERSGGYWCVPSKGKSAEYGRVVFENRCDAEDCRIFSLYLRKTDLQKKLKAISVLLLDALDARK